MTASMRLISRVGGSNILLIDNQMSAKVTCPAASDAGEPLFRRCGTRGESQGARQETLCVEHFLFKPDS
jgi:hypothetical protein